MQVFLNNKIVPIEKAQISVLDRGFLFGDGVYEVLLCEKKAIVAFGLHIQRLRHSLHHIDLLKPLDNFDWQKAVKQVIDANSNWVVPYGIYVHVTRGADAYRRHEFSGDVKPTVFIMPIKKAVTTAKLEQGIKAMLMLDTRKNSNFIKSTSLLENVILKQKSYDNQADESILYRDDLVYEGSSSNVFIVKNNQISTPKDNGTILSGITRKLIIIMAKDMNLAIEERPIRIQELLTADEVWVSSSTKEIIPVVQIDDSTIGCGNVGNMFKKINTYFQQHKCDKITADDFCKIE